MANNKKRFLPEQTKKDVLEGIFFIHRKIHPMNKKRSARTGRNTRWKASYFYIVAGIKICYNTDVCKANRKERMGIVMIKAEKLSYSFPQKDLYNNISFTLEEDVHCAFIGTNGTGKSTLVDMILQPDNYLYEGKLTVEVPGRIGYVSQFYSVEDKPEMTVFDYLSDEFVRLQGEINRICDEMATAEDFEEVMEHYQKAMDEFQAIDGDFYESNIRKQLKLANLQDYENHLLTNLSGGEFKLVQVIREMMVSPKFVIMDEPDVFLDFEHLNALKNLINAHKGTLLVITHNRYLLNHCFNKILHLENAEIQEFDGTYIEYNFAMLQMKIEQQELAAADLEEIERNRRLVERLRNEATRVDSATKGRTLKARVSLLERLEARKTRSPFVDIKQPAIELYTTAQRNGSKAEPETVSESADQPVLSVEHYSVAFDRQILEDVSFSLQAGEKVAIVGPNGTGKTTILREIYRHANPAVQLDPEAKVAYLSQMHGEVFREKKTVLANFEDAGFEKDADIIEYLKTYGFEEELAYNRVENLSGGEKNLLQLAKISRMDADLLLLDEPNSHLDTYSQLALEASIEKYQGAVLMVSHDFYTVANCMDYVLYVEDKKLRKMSIRKFRKMIYADHFDKDYLELEQKKKETENRIAFLLQAGKFEDARKYCEELETIIDRM